MVLIFTNKSTRGCIEAGSKKYIFEVFPAKDSEFSGLIKVDWRLKVLLGDSIGKFLKDSKFHDVYEFHDKLSDFVQKKISNTEEIVKWFQNPKKTSDFIKILKEEIGIVGDSIKDIDIENGGVNVEVTDSQLRIHKARLKLSEQYKVEPIQIIRHDLPLQRMDSVAGLSFSHVLSVSEFCLKFKELVTHFQEFWNRMAVLDSQCYVLDPANPTFKDVYRRLKLTDTLSVVLTFNPFFPKEKPHMKLLGCYLDVNHYQNILQNNLESNTWDPEEDLLYNLSNILEITLPGKMSSEVSDMADLAEKGECAICFCWRLKNEIPSEKCENHACRLMYHSTCLFKYLSSLPRNRDYFSIIQGECPNCDCGITCAVPKFI